MTRPDIERAAYIAAHALNDANYHCDRATRGGRQSYKIDKMAQIIKGVFETYEQDGKAPCYAKVRSIAEGTQATRGPGSSTPNEKRV